MRVLTCKGCNADYFPVQADGLTYFHVCPDNLPSVNNTDMTGLKTPVQVAPLPRTVADIRNENVPATDATATKLIKAAGKDVLVKVP